MEKRQRRKKTNGWGGGRTKHSVVARPGNSYLCSMSQSRSDFDARSNSQQCCRGQSCRILIVGIIGLMVSAVLDCFQDEWTKHPEDLNHEFHEIRDHLVTLVALVGTDINGRREWGSDVDGFINIS
jgi:hypothetical protein